MISTTIFPGRYIQGYEAIQRLGKEVARLGSNASLICDPFVFDTLLPVFRNQIEQNTEIVVERFEGECSDEEIARLVDKAKITGTQVIVGMGGGKVMDTAKAVAYELKLPEKLRREYDGRHRIKYGLCISTILLRDTSRIRCGSQSILRGKGSDTGS
jgi:glycerol dehydrogenase-like iron-containing ADH family enzyme